MRKNFFKAWLLGLCLAAFSICAAQQQSAAAPSTADEPGPTPVLSGGLAFVPIWDGGNPTLVSIFSPVGLLPLSDNLIFEARGEFEGDFVRRNGNSGDFTGAVDKSLEYAQFDYIGNRYVTFSLGRFLTPFNIFNERLYPNWIRNMQTDPLILPIATGSDNGVMLRGAIDVARNMTINYAAYFSALSNLNHLESERHTGFRTSLFLPRRRLEIGTSLQHQMQDDQVNRYGLHLLWQPLRVPFDLRSEAVYSRQEGNGMWLEGAYRLTQASPTLIRRMQVVGRTQMFHVGTVAGLNPELPNVNTKRTEFGLNYYLNDGWKALASYGRTFTAAGNSNLWTVGMTYRFVFPLGPTR